MERDHERKVLETEESKIKKKPYEAPVLTRHDPLDSVSTVTYYYYFH